MKAISILLKILSWFEIFNWSVKQILFRTFENALFSKIKDDDLWLMNHHWWSDLFVFQSLKFKRNSQTLMNKVDKISSEKIELFRKYII